MSLVSACRCDRRARTRICRDERVEPIVEFESGIDVCGDDSRAAEDIRLILIARDHFSVGRLFLKSSAQVSISSRNSIRRSFGLPPTGSIDSAYTFPSFTSLWNQPPI